VANALFLSLATTNLVLRIGKKGIACKPIGL